jgi:predicted kinase
VITVVTGSPGSGKTTYVAERKGREDIVLDFDEIAYALGSSVDHHSVPHLPVHIHLAKIAWVAVWKEITHWRFKSKGDIWIIHANPKEFQQERYKERNAKHIHLPEQERK